MTEVDKEYRERMQAFHEQVILVVGFLGGIVFAGLVLILGNPSFIMKNPITGSPTGLGESYFEVLVALLTLVCGLSAVTVLFALLCRVLPMSVRGMSMMYRRVYAMAGATFATFMGALYLIVGPVIQWPAYYIIGGLGVVGLFLALELRKATEMQ